MQHSRLTRQRSASCAASSTSGANSDCGETSRSRAATQRPSIASPARASLTTGGRGLRRDPPACAAPRQQYAPVTVGSTGLKATADAVGWTQAGRCRRPQRVVRYACKIVDQAGREVMAGIEVAERVANGPLRRILMFHGPFPPRRETTPTAERPWDPRTLRLGAPDLILRAPLSSFVGSATTNWSRRQTRLLRASSDRSGSAGTRRLAGRLRSRRRCFMARILGRRINAP